MKEIELIQAALSPDLLKAKYRHLQDIHFTGGHCYHAAEALWHLLGGKSSDWQPCVYREEDGITHWWLQNKVTGDIADPTKEQYNTDILPYNRGKGKGCGFLTATPSKSAQTILNRISERSSLAVQASIKNGESCTLYDVLAETY